MMRTASVAGLAALLAASPAAAFKRPQAQPDDKLQSCPEVGEGYVRVPGSNTCVRLGGYVRAEVAGIKGGR